MADVLVSDLPDDVLAAIDRHASRLGLSRGEYVRRLLSQEAARDDGRVEAADLARLSRLLADLADPGVRNDAWG
ncbi:ribbon-helix-helix protein, CopG family [Kribbella sp. NPDC006257]|uniref:type II toxin-antitoxin system VapB family antitoxin n=1 Tax=Kribbella sp. NPDC006257 TaxID=3156738 RepID=UPI0033BB60C5